MKYKFLSIVEINLSELGINDYCVVKVLDPTTHKNLNFLYI